MGRHLGDLGVARARDDTFGWFGATIRVGESFSDLRLIGFLELAQTIDEADELASMKALRDFLHSIVHPEDWEVFWQGCMDNGQGVVDLITLVRRLTEATSDIPSQRRSGSSTGRRKTKGSSKEDSSSRVIRRLEKRGRPDLAVVVEMARDERSTG
jgi:hypothetical protein